MLCHGDLTMRYSIWLGLVTTLWAGCKTIEKEEAPPPKPPAPFGEFVGKKLPGNEWKMNIATYGEPKYSTMSCTWEKVGMVEIEGKQYGEAKGKGVFSSNPVEVVLRFERTERGWKCIEEGPAASSFKIITTIEVSKSDTYEETWIDTSTANYPCMAEIFCGGGKHLEK